MIPQKQLVFGGGNGDCFRACVASILELPNCDLLPNDHSPEWHFTWEEWLSQFGLILDFDAKRIWRETYWIASVKSKNLVESSHAIVMKSSQVAFDPSTKKRYRKGSFLKGDEVNGGWWFEVADFRLLHKLDEFREALNIKAALATGKERMSPYHTIVPATVSATFVGHVNPPTEGKEKE